MQKSSNVVEIAILHHPSITRILCNWRVVILLTHSFHSHWNPCIPHKKCLWLCHHQWRSEEVRNCRTLNLLRSIRYFCTGKTNGAIRHILTRIDNNDDKMNCNNAMHMNGRARQVSERLLTWSKKTYAISDRLQTHHQNAHLAHVFTCGLSEWAEHASCNMADVTATDDGKLSKKWVSFSALSPFKWWELKYCFAFRDFFKLFQEFGALYDTAPLTCHSRCRPGVHMGLSQTYISQHSFRFHLVDVVVQDIPQRPSEHRVVSVLWTTMSTTPRSLKMAPRRQPCGRVVYFSCVIFLYD